MRSTELERLDTGDYTLDEYYDCLKKLGQVGRWMGGNRATNCAFKSLNEAPTSVLDVGCGGGEFLRLLQPSYPDCFMQGIDLNPDAITYAEQFSSSAKFLCQPLEEIPTNSFDVVMTTLVCHHLRDDDLINFLKECQRVAKRTVIMTDLHRHPIASLGFGVIAPLLFRNSLITHDGLISIKRAFTRSDWIRLLDSAGFLPEQWKLTWHCAFLWVVRIECAL
jgi:2-polyprenyl-3-methyl-5-hydroxy-6-metoxy-1,4-benzoquinol methylase